MLNQTHVESGVVNLGVVVGGGFLVGVLLLLFLVLICGATCYILKRRLRTRNRNIMQAAEQQQNIELALD